MARCAQHYGQVRTSLWPGAHIILARGAHHYGQVRTSLLPGAHIITPRCAHHYGQVCTSLWPGWSRQNSSASVGLIPFNCLDVWPKSPRHQSVRAPWAPSARHGEQNDARGRAEPNSVKVPKSNHSYDFLDFWGAYKFVRRGGLKSSKKPFLHVGYMQQA